MYILTDSNQSDKILIYFYLSILFKYIDTLYILSQWGEVTRRLPTQGLHLMLDFQKERQQRHKLAILGQPPRDLG